MSLATKVAYNTAIQIAGRLFGLVITLVTVSFIANHLFVDGSALRGYGQYTIIFTYVAIIGSAADLGLFTLLVREISGRTRDQAGQLVGNALAFRLLLFALTLVIFLVLYQFLPYLTIVNQGVIVGVLIAFTMLFSQIIATVFQANLLADRIVVSETIGKLFIVVGTIAVLKLGYGLMSVVLVNLIGQILIFGISFLLVRRLVTIKLRLDFSLWRQLLPQFSTIALINLLTLIHFKADMLLLTFFKSEADVGVYGVASKLFEVVLVIPAIFATNLLPVLSAVMLEGRREDASQILKRSSSILFVVAAFLVVTLVAYAPLAIVFVTQPDFLVSVTPLRILMASLVFIFITTLLGQAMIASRHQAALVRGYLLAVVINILLNLYAIPRYSYVGAATAAVITQAILLAYTLRVSRQHFRDIINWPVFGRVLLAALATLTFFYFLPLGKIEPSSFADAGKLVQAGWLLAAFTAVGGVFFLALLATFKGSFQRVFQIFNVK